ncbi:MAG: hypothetical protein SGJ10_03600, partial [Bacteroidota bacterium]|nr:hypothetical protein [Bacteroidota bacterium]
TLYFIVVSLAANSDNYRGFLFTQKGSKSVFIYQNELSTEKTAITVFPNPAFNVTSITIDKSLGDLSSLNSIKLLVSYY